MNSDIIQLLNTNSIPAWNMNNFRNKLAIEQQNWFLDPVETMVVTKGKGGLGMGGMIRGMFFFFYFVEETLALYL